MGRRICVSREPAIATTPDKSLRQYAAHPRDWHDNLYVYPVISRRSGGLSIGINLNPDAACNFDCIYCQVDRTVPPRTREVDVAVLDAELRVLIAAALSGLLFEDAAFADVPMNLRAIRDIALSGDGEPTTCRYFREAVETIARVKFEAGLAQVKIVLITDACYLTRPEVVAGLTVLDANQGEIWAKLDAGTEDYFRLVNRPNVSLRHVIDNIIATARVRPIVIQSLFMRVQGAAPSREEIDAYVARLREIVSGGGQIALVQVYTVARRPAQDFVDALMDEEVDRIVHAVRTGVSIPTEAYYGAGSP